MTDPVRCPVCACSRVETLAHDRFYCTECFRIFWERGAQYVHIPTYKTPESWRAAR